MKDISDCNPLRNP